MEKFLSRDLLPKSSCIFSLSQGKSNYPPPQNLLLSPSRIFNIHFIILFDTLMTNLTTSIREANIAYRKLAKEHHLYKYNKDGEFSEKKELKSSTIL